jgi:diazepam-binding inhibitor (GABA receptor modulator, acyl-CoA-binding protein)
MSAHQAEFEAIAKQFAENPNGVAAPPDSQKLEIYSLYKQGTVGDINIERPGITDPKGQAKWDAWNGRKGVSQEDAQHQYIELVRSIMG